MGQITIDRLTPTGFRLIYNHDFSAVASRFSEPKVDIKVYRTSPFNSQSDVSQVTLATPTTDYIFVPTQRDFFFPNVAYTARVIGDNRGGTPYETLYQTFSVYAPPVSGVSFYASESFNYNNFKTQNTLSRSSNFYGEFLRFFNTRFAENYTGIFGYDRVGILGTFVPNGTGTIEIIEFFEYGTSKFSLFGNLDYAKYLSNSSTSLKLATYIFSGNDYIVGSYDNDTLGGFAGDDIIVGGLGNDNIDGGLGDDILVVSGLPSQYSFNGNTLTGVDGVDTLTSIEFIRFGASLSNKQLFSDLMPSQLTDPDGNGPRLSPVNELIKSFSVLYIAYFNRSPDIEGLMYWFKELNSGKQSLSQVSAGFTQSPEYSKAYPAGSSNREFIAQIYQNLFDRAPDTEGWNFWENSLNAGSPRDSFILTIINGAYAPTGGAGDRALLDNKHAVSLHYTEKLSSTPTEAFDMGISTVLNRVTNNPATVNQGLAVIDHVMDNPITLTGLINDAQAFDAYWAA